MTSNPGAPQTDAPRTTSSNLFSILAIVFGIPAVIAVWAVLQLRSVR